MSNHTHDSQEALQQIIDSAQRLGVELDEADALQWLTAVAAQKEPVVVDQDRGVFGHHIAMLDFSDADLAHFRKIGHLVSFADVPGQVETALALSGSAAQSKIQTYPGDADYFERVNIIAPTQAAACQILGRIMRQKALDTLSGDYYQLIEVKIGSYPTDMIVNDQRRYAGSPISWRPSQIEAGYIDGHTPEGEPLRLTWDEAAQDPGWCKMDWVIADTVRHQLVNASNMLDVTWEAPNGRIIPLDGYLDTFFQEVYLEAESIPIFSKLVKQLSSDAIDNYVSSLEKEVKKYVVDSPNYGKAAKRMYNVFRLTGRYTEAAYLRELFDEPTTMLYQVGALVRTIDDSFKPGSAIEVETIENQASQLIVMVTETFNGEMETEIIRLLLKLKDAIYQDASYGKLSARATAAQNEIISVVNGFFHSRMTGLPAIEAYLVSVQEV